MLWNIDFFWAVMAFAAVVGISYMLCLLMESSIGREGFGPFGNAALMTAGFFLSILAANYRGVSLDDLQQAVIWGIGGAFSLTLVMILLRAALRRMWPS